MKKLILGFICMFAFNTYAVTVFCSQQNLTDNNDGRMDYQKRDNQPNYHNLSSGETNGSGRCAVLDIKKGKFNLKGYTDMKISQGGIGMKFTGAEAFMINCPLVTSLKKLQRSPFYGLKVSASVVAGGTVGIFSNKRLGVCILTAVSGVSLGFDASGAKLTFSDGYED